MNLEDKNLYLIHYTQALLYCMLGIVFEHAWLAGFGTAFMLTWIWRMRFHQG